MYVRLRPQETKTVNGLRLTNPGPKALVLVVLPADRVIVESDQKPAKCFDESTQND